MKIKLIGKPTVVMSNFESKHNYFGWPTAARLQNGKIAVVASGFRFSHICPFGKTVISYSENDGESYTAPAPVIDTVLDDRDGGIMTFGENGVIVTSFNNTVDFQKKYIKFQPANSNCTLEAEEKYRLAYLDTVSKEEENEAIGATFKISNDCGVTFSKLFKSPITSPHGPVELKDGSILWVGTTFLTDYSDKESKIMAYRINPDDGSMEYVGEIENIMVNGESLMMCEPHTIELPDGTLVCHIRENKHFTIYQSISVDGGKTWSTPVKLLGDTEGAPAHLFLHSSGVLIDTYSYRNKPYGIKAMFSTDGGTTWDTSGYDIYSNEVSWDLGYPSTVELQDGSMLTIFYARRTNDEPAIILQQRWKFEL